MTVNRTIPAIRETKRRDGADPLVMVTAYDAPSSRVATEADVDLILVGDSLAMVVLGYDNTLAVTVDDMAYHVGAVARAKPTAVVVGDLPWMAFHVSKSETATNAATLIRAGASCVKLEGGSKRVPMIEAILAAEIPVMGHIGLTPQSAHVMGGFKVQGRQEAAAEQLLAEAKCLEEAGCFAVVIEGVPDVVGKMATDALSIPTIGIGAGPDTDGQVLVYHDLIGLENRFKPRFVRRYGTAFDDQVSALSAFANDVRRGGFPTADESYQASDELTDALGLYGSGGTH
ncbi:MAG: 3-methyl-2-oxobutanoate hydroxymethyltransferase [Actinomycetia bacterium]|nr:3-methyl-2-oxobutanoate hydroxymethyltransferase [Actinomycetes bacterium]MCP4223240.1 3-methyl-2-oxobutanoate hydroxymethyltransferase [Actinomycetes bacterium]MCP5033688.1 3-methyl-2-oxobutanoate hydroxymethyltransferase [Actinomycetes bacterium]